MLSAVKVEAKTFYVPAYAPDIVLQRNKTCLNSLDQATGPTFTNKP